MIWTGIIFGVFFWIWGLILFLTDYLQAKRCTAETAAVIVDVAADSYLRRDPRGGKRRIYYHPIVEFRTPEKTVRVRVSSKAYLPDTYVIGETLNIRYDPRNPHDVRLQKRSLRESVIGMIFFFLAGAVLFYVCMRAGRSG